MRNIGAVTVTLIAALLASTIHAQSLSSQLRSQQAEPPPVLTIPVAPQAPERLPPPGPTSGPPGNVLDLPSVWAPTPAEPLPAPPPAIAEVTVPDGFIGCWNGKPVDWDDTHVFNGHVLGSPGEIVFCYSRNGVDVPEVVVAITPGRRLLNLVSNLFLAYDTFEAHGIHTDVYGISPTKVHGKTKLTVQETTHQLDIIPVKEAQEPSDVEWAAELVESDHMVLRARQVMYYDNGVPAFAGEWHCDFHRVNAEGTP